MNKKMFLFTVSPNVDLGCDWQLFLKNLSIVLYIFYAMFMYIHPLSIMEFFYSLFLNFYISDLTIM